MSMSSFAPMDVVYPESDGKPMSENMHQGQIIRMLINGFDRQYADDPMMLVGGDCFWYPVEGQQHGVDEYWVFDPDSGGLEVWMRNTNGPAQRGASGLAPPTRLG